VTVVPPAVPGVPSPKFQIYFIGPDPVEVALKVIGDCGMGERVFADIDTDGSMLHPIVITHCPESLSLIITR
jgi:hypothetical protein